MLAWLFRPTCPCDPAAKAWVEERLQWLAEEFDDSAFNGRRIVLPAEEYFPDRYKGTKKDVRRLLDRVCEFMDVVPDLVALKFVADAGKIWLVNEGGDYLPGAAGTYEEGEQKFIIRIDKSGLDDPLGLVGTMAHELAHVRLLGESRIMREVFDNELLTDLTVVHFGLGLFLANTPRNWDSQYSTWPDSDLLKPEYMTPPMFGWALAHLAWFRGEKKPQWARYLSWGARANLKQGLRYLQETGDSSYTPARLRNGLRGKPSIRENSDDR
jgi:hypothetical protein